MATLTVQKAPSPAEPPPKPGRWTNRTRWIALSAVLAVWVVLGIALQGRNTQDLPVSQLTDFQEWLNTLRNWIEQAKFDNNPMFLPLEWISEVLNWVFEQLHRAFVSDSARTQQAAIIGWAGVVAIAVWVGYALAGLRIAAVVAVSMLAFGYLGYWEESIDTLIITGVSVAICVVIGLPLGDLDVPEHQGDLDDHTRA